MLSLERSLRRCNIVQHDSTKGIAVLVHWLCDSLVLLTQTLPCFAPTMHCNLHFELLDVFESITTTCVWAIQGKMATDSDTSVLLLARMLLRGPNQSSEMHALRSKVEILRQRHLWNCMCRYRPAVPPLDWPNDAHGLHARSRLVQPIF